MLKDVLRRSREALSCGGIENADYEAQCIIEHVTGFDRARQIAHGDAELTDAQKRKVEFLVNECCDIGCSERRECYENVSRRALDEDCLEHICHAPGGSEGYRFSKAMKNPAFISLEDIEKTYLPAGFTNFKIEGRSLGSALILEFLLYYLTKPEHQLEVRELIYLDSELDLF